MMDERQEYPRTKGAESMQALPTYQEYRIGGTVYQVSSVFSDNGSSLQDLFEKFVIQEEKR